jgi:hypothetical protein
MGSWWSGHRWSGRGRALAHSYDSINLYKNYTLIYYIIPLSSDFLSLSSSSSLTCGTAVVIAPLCRLGMGGLGGGSGVWRDGGSR